VIMRERGVSHRAQAVRRWFLAIALASVFLATAACHGSQTGERENGTQRALNATAR